MVLQKTGTLVKFHRLMTYRKTVDYLGRVTGKLPQCPNFANHRPWIKYSLSICPIKDESVLSGTI